MEGKWTHQEFNPQYPNGRIEKLFSVILCRRKSFLTFTLITFVLSCFNLLVMLMAVFIVLIGGGGEMSIVYLPLF